MLTTEITQTSTECEDKELLVFTAVGKYTQSIDYIEWSVDLKSECTYVLMMVNLYVIYAYFR